MRGTRHGTRLEGGARRGETRRWAGRGWWMGAAAVVAWFSGGAPHAPAELGAQAAPTGQTHVLVVTGASGAPEYAARFHETAITLLDAVRDRAGVPAANIVYLAENPAVAPARITGRSARADVERAFARLAERAGPSDRVFIMLIGHGSHDGAASRLNLPGPDLTAADYARLLDAVRAPVAFVNAASASGDFIAALKGERRIVMTATKSAFERNESIFAEHFARAFADGGADTDKDGRVSMLEAFDFARREVVRVYERDRRLLTEHAMLDDDGDGVGSATPGAQAKDGRAARAFVLGGTAVASAAPSDDPRVNALRVERAALERRVADLRARKDGMEAAAYTRELETLLVALAEKTRELRAAEGGKP